MSKQCDHGHLRRVCEICERDDEIKQLKAERDALKAAAEKGTEYVLAHINQDLRNKIASVAAAEREKVAHWMIQRSYATGHGDTTEDLLSELEWQIRESEREACEAIAKQQLHNTAMLTRHPPLSAAAWDIRNAIRARGEA